MIEVCTSNLSVLLEETLEAFHLEAVVDIGVPLEGRLEESSVSPSPGSRVLLVAHIVVRQSWQLSALPAEVALVPAHVQSAKEEHAIADQRELVNVSHLNGVLGLDHFDEVAIDFY